jgi:hypothetical protein
MTMRAKQHPAETLIDWTAPAVPAAASAWSAWTVVGTPASGLMAGAFAFALAMLAIRVLGRSQPTHVEAAFEPLSF